LKKKKKVSSPLLEDILDWFAIREDFDVITLVKLNIMLEDDVLFQSIDGDFRGIAYACVTRENQQLSMTNTSTKRT
jgi:hypothetical protein